VARRVSVWGHEGGEYCGRCHEMAGHHSLGKVEASSFGRERQEGTSRLSK
jgi:hypothetical protein